MSTLFVYYRNVEHPNISQIGTNGMLDFNIFQNSKNKKNHEIQDFQEFLAFITCLKPHGHEILDFMTFFKKCVFLHFEDRGTHFEGYYCILDKKWTFWGKKIKNPFPRYQIFFHTRDGTAGKKFFQKIFFI